jgi:hypothetical protein
VAGRATPSMPGFAGATDRPKQQQPTNNY